MRFFVYGYFRPGEEAPFYIGKGCGNRHLDHWLTVRAGKKIGNKFLYGALSKLKLANQEPVIHKLAHCVSEEAAYELEAELIMEHGRLIDGSGPLCNIDPGFYNRIGFKGKAHTEETKKKLRKARGPQVNMRKPKLPEHREKLKANGNNVMVEWLLKSPAGETLQVVNLKRFCDERNLNPTPIYRSFFTGKQVSRGRSMGWQALQRF